MAETGIARQVNADHEAKVSDKINAKIAATKPVKETVPKNINLGLADFQNQYTQ